MAEEKNAFRKAVFRESFWTFLTTIISRFGALLFTVILARFLMPEGFGLYSLALSISIIFITLADLGINQSLLRYVSSSIEKNKNKASAYFYYLLGLKIKVALISSLVLLLLAYLLSNFIFRKPELFPLLIVLSFYTFITAIQGFFESLFYTKNKVSLLSIKEIVFQICRVVLVLAIFFIISKNNYVVGAMTGLLMSAVITLFLVLVFFFRTFDFHKTSKIQINKKRVLVFLGFMTLSNTALVLFSYMDNIIMGFFLSLNYIGYYRASMGLIITIAGALSFSGVFLSNLTKIKEEKIQESFDKIIKVILILIIPAIFGTVILSKYFLVFVYGYDYLQSATVLYVLSPMIFLFVMASIFLNLLAAREKTRDFSVLTISCTILNIILNIAAIKIFLPYSQIAATIGVAASTTASWLIYFIGGVGILKMRMKIIFRFKFLIAPIIASTVMALVLYLIQYLSPDMTIIKGIIEVALGAIVYFAVLFILREINREDIDFLRSFLHR